MRSRKAPAWMIALLVILPLLVSACGKTVGETIDDATITTRVKTALLNDPQVAGLKIDVDTTKGIVTMSGIVRSRDEEQRAVQIARGVPGVKDVKSTLQLRPPSRSQWGSAGLQAGRVRSTPRCGPGRARRRARPAASGCRQRAPAAHR